ncbi:hypothetical protein EHS25_008944 [Saitozyma podzolica]|uniref:Major facilitator superfamily (MFS) profile domain-containing protein n=1 Tax=Saitozyma podzolica TaxID=1890683 RepID=A0A427YN17_9TREE|nr:hypothetical protein EHS25_008944 [Saitozyma podzolica]
MTYWLLMVMRAIQATGGSPAIGTGSGTVGDIATPGERGRFMGLFQGVALIGPAFGPVLGGILVQYLSWRWIFWVLAIWGGVTVTCLFFFLPETLRAVVGNGSVPPTLICSRPVDLARKRERKMDAEALETTFPVPEKKPYKPFASFQMLAYPEILLILVFGSCAFMCMFASLTILSSVLADNYGYDDVKIGLCYLPQGLGSMVIGMWGGRLHDWQFARIKRRLDFRPRHARDLEGYPIEKCRLAFVPLYIPLYLASVVGYGWMLDKTVNIAGPLVMSFAIGMGAQFSTQMCSLLLIDMFPANAGASSASFNLIRCAMSAVVTAIVDPLIRSVGLGWTFTILGGIADQCALYVPRRTPPLAFENAEDDLLSPESSDVRRSIQSRSPVERNLGKDNTRTAPLNHYFKFENQLRYPIHEAAFRQALDMIYAHSGSAEGPSLACIKNLPLVFIVLAQTAMGAGEELFGDERTRRSTSHKWYWSSTQIASAIQPESLELVLTHLLTSMYLILVLDRRLTEAWSTLALSVRAAQAIGCHRDGSSMDLNPFDTEYRRRVWSYVYHAEKHYALILGRPPAINEAYVDAHEPSNVDLEGIKPGQPIVSKPLTQPTTATFHILRRRFAQILGKIGHHFQKKHELATYHEVETLDDEILDFVNDLPPHFRLEDPDTSLDHVHLYIALHRYAIGTEIALTRILLHFWNVKYMLSRNACFDSAKLDFRLVSSMDISKLTSAAKLSPPTPAKAWHFVHGSISGIHADEMRLILTTFLDRHPVDKQSNKPQTSQKEVAIMLQDATDLTSTQPQDPLALFLGVSGDTARHPIPTVGPELSEDARFANPDFGEEHSTALLVRDIYAMMVEKGMVTRPPSRRPDRALASPAVHNSNAMATKPPVDGPLPWTQLIGRSAVDADPQQTFDNWLAGNATAVQDDGLATVQGGVLGGLDEFSFLDNSIWPSAFQAELPGDFSVIQDFAW